MCFFLNVHNDLNKQKNVVGTSQKDILYDSCITEIRGQKGVVCSN